MTCKLYSYGKPCIYSRFSWIFNLHSNYVFLLVGVSCVIISCSRLDLGSWYFSCNGIKLTYICFSFQHSKNGNVTALIWGALPQPRSDRQKDRVETNPEQLTAASVHAEISFCHILIWKKKHIVYNFKCVWVKKYWFVFSYIIFGW